MVVRILRKVPAAALGCAAFTVLSSGALAFFPPVPTGSDEVRVSPISPIIPVVPPPVAVVPPVPPPVVIPKEVPKPKPPYCICPPGPIRPSEVPEPMTLISGLVGLSVLGAAALKRKLGKSKPEATPSN